MQQNSTAAVAPSQTPLTAHTAPPDNLVGSKGDASKGDASRRAGRGKEGEQKGR